MVPVSNKRANDSPATASERSIGLGVGSVTPVRRVASVSASPRKRARLHSSTTDTDPEPDSETEEQADKTTSQSPRSVLPRTPSPSHQGIHPDNSKTPAVGAGLSSTSSFYPTFATTPLPAEPRSPTTDFPPSAHRDRPRASSFAALTPGRKRIEPVPAPRAVSQAHMELTTITETEEYHAPSPAASAPFLGPSLSRDVTPSRLSPSPSIMESRFAHPAYPSRPPSRTPSRGRHRQSSSPAREYMDVALHGLAPNPQDSPSAMATPGHRTMLGTERYRDTRFGDIPMMQWESPNIDLGPATPAGGGGPPGRWGGLIDSL